MIPFLSMRMPVITMKIISTIISMIIFSIVSTFEVSGATINLAVGESARVEVSDGVGYSFIDIQSVSCTNNSVSVEKIGLTVKVTVKAYFPGEATVTSRVRYKLYPTQPYQYYNHSFTVACKSNGGGSGDVNTPKLELSHSEITVEQGQWSPNIHTTLTTIDDGTAKWTIDDESIAKIDRREYYRTKVIGENPGTTYLRAVSRDGGTAKCKITVTRRIYGTTEVFFGITDDEPKVNLRCYIPQDDNNSCVVLINQPDYPYDDNRIYKVEKIPEYVAGNRINKIGLVHEGDENNGIISFNIPSFIQEIESCAFANVHKLRDIYIPSTVNIIGSEAFRDCIDLERVECHFNENDGDYIFRHCEALEFALIKSGEIPVGCFYDCENLRSVTFQNEVSKIKESAFYNCVNLKEVNIPGSIKSIEWRAFYKCSSLCEVNLSEGVNDIEIDAFRDCNLTEITLPASLKSIDGTCVIGNPIKRIKVLNPKPAILGNSFPNGIILEVPAGSAEAYANEWRWNRANIVEADVEPSNYVIYKALDKNETELSEGWTFNNINIGNLDYVWSWKDYNGNYYLNASAYKNKANAAEAYAISPEISLKGYKNCNLTFDHAAKFQTTLRNLCGFVVRESNATEWTSVEIPTWPKAGYWEFVNSGTIDFSAYDGKNIVIAFKYVSTADGADTWEIQNLVINGSEENNGVEVIEIDNPEVKTEYFNLQGVRVENPANGFFIVKRGNKVTKEIIP